MKANETRYPRLTRAVLRRLDREQLADVARHGADAGWAGFTYTAETVAFYKAHKADILDLANQLASDLGEDTIAMIQGFRCLGHQARFTGAWACDYSANEIAEALYSGRGESADTIREAMAWFALEEVARELNTDI